MFERNVKYYDSIPFKSWLCQQRVFYESKERQQKIKF